VLDAVAQAMSPEDAAIVQRSEVRRILRQTIEEAFRQGGQGAARDVVILGRRWGFDVKDVSVPVVLWQRANDSLVRPAMGRYLAARLSHCEAHFIPNAGHLLMIDRMPEVVGALLTP